MQNKTLLVVIAAAILGVSSTAMAKGVVVAAGAAREGQALAIFMVASIITF
jgi:hypothetical protein